MDSHLIISLLTADLNFSKAEAVFHLAEKDIIHLYLSSHVVVEVIVFFGAKRLIAYDSDGRPRERNPIPIKNITDILTPFFEKNFFVHPEKENFLRILDKFSQQQKLSTIYDLFIIYESSTLGLNLVSEDKKLRNQEDFIGYSVDDLLHKYS